MMTSEISALHPQADRVHAMVLRELVFRRRPTVNDLAALTGLGAGTIQGALAALVARGSVVRDRTGAILAAYVANFNRVIEIYHRHHSRG